MVQPTCVPGIIVNGNKTCQWHASNFQVNTTELKLHLHNVLSRRNCLCEGAQPAPISVRFSSISSDCIIIQFQLRCECNPCTSVVRAMACKVRGHRLRVCNHLYFRTTVLIRKPIYPSLKIIKDQTRTNNALRRFDNYILNVTEENILLKRL